jgi:glutamyl-tRNA reductase
MQDLAIVGANWRTASMQTLGRLLLPKEDAAARLKTLAGQLGARELLYLGTCNRLDVVLRLPPHASVEALRPRVFAALAGRDPDGREATQIFRVWAGAAAVEHLLLVACGLDSAQVGDREIANQLRDAWLLSRRAGVAGPRLDELAAAALLAAREARELHDGAGGPARKGLATRAAGHVLRHLDGSRETVALIGVSPMTRSAGRGLAESDVPLLVVNRSFEAAARLAEDLNARAISLADFTTTTPSIGAIVTAVGAAEPVLEVASLRALAQASAGRRRPLIVDLGVPANVRPEAAVEAELPYVGMDTLVGEAAAGRRDEVLERTEVRAVVDRHLDRAMRTSAQRLAGPLVGALHESYVSNVEAELAALLQGSLAGLDDTQRAALRRWGSLLARRMAHVPVDGLRRLACEGDLASVEACIDGMTRALEKRRTQ